MWNIIIIIIVIIFIIADAVVDGDCEVISICSPVC